MKSTEEEERELEEEKEEEYAIKRKAHNIVEMIKDKRRRFLYLFNSEIRLRGILLFISTPFFRKVKVNRSIVSSFGVT